MTPASLSFPASGGHATVNVTIAGGCPWSPVASDAWITATPAGGQVSIEVAANSGQATRSGLVHVRGAVIAIAQDGNSNLVANPGFESGISGWSEVFSTGPGSVTFNGAAIITSAAINSGHQLSQCVAITGGKRYESGARVLIPAGQSSGIINFAIYEYWEAGCPVSPGYHGSRILSASQPLNAWFDQSITWNTDFNAKAVLVVIGAGGTANPPFTAWFDDVYLREKP